MAFQPTGGTSKRNVENHMHDLQLQQSTRLYYTTEWLSGWHENNDGKIN